MYVTGDIIMVLSLVNIVEGSPDMLAVAMAIAIPIQMNGVIVPHSYRCSNVINVHPSPAVPYREQEAKIIQIWMIFAWSAIIIHFWMIIDGLKSSVFGTRLYPEEEWNSWS